MRVLPVLVLAGTLTGCGASTAAVTPMPSAVPTESTGVPGVQPTAVPSIAPPPTITGFGALVADWNSAHTPSPSCTPGACYNPDPSLPTVGGNVGSHYVLVFATGGRILNYTLNLVRGTPQAAAMLAVLQEFPTDVRTIWTARRDTCLQMEVASAQLGALLSDPSVGDRGGYVFVEFQSDPDAQGNSTYSASSVTAATFQPGPLYTSAAAAGVPC